MTRERLQGEFNRLHQEATTLAGRLADVAQRATVYRHLFLASGGNHAFPLIAAHGALWASGYFRSALQLGNALSWQYLGRPELRRRQLNRLDDFANAFRDINRRVCIDTYVNFHFTETYGDRADVEHFVPADLLEPLQQIHAARRAGRTLTDPEKRVVFEAHFRHEQARVVGPTLTAAVAAFDWPLVRALALKPSVRFAYFPAGTTLWFRNFASQDERIEKGLTAFAFAAQAGWSTVDAALQRYHLLPDAAFTGRSDGFAELRGSLLTAT